MLEARLPVVKSVVIQKVFMPYVIYLILFSIYAKILIFNDDMVSFVFANIIEV